MKEEDAKIHKPMVINIDGTDDFEDSKDSVQITDTKYKLRKPALKSPKFINVTNEGLVK